MVLMKRDIGPDPFEALQRALFQGLKDNNQTVTQSAISDHVNNFNNGTEESTDVEPEAEVPSNESINKTETGTDNDYTDNEENTDNERELSDGTQISHVSDNADDLKDKDVNLANKPDDLKLRDSVNDNTDDSINITSANKDAGQKVKDSMSSDTDANDLTNKAKNDSQDRAITENTNNALPKDAHVYEAHKSTGEKLGDNYTVNRDASKTASVGNKTVEGKDIYNERTDQGTVHSTVPSSTTPSSTAPTKVGVAKGLGSSNTSASDTGATSGKPSNKNTTPSASMMQQQGEGNTYMSKPSKIKSLK